MDFVELLPQVFDRFLDALFASPVEFELDNLAAFLDLNGSFLFLNFSEDHTGLHS